ncbi:hypothetical protein ACEPAF_4193 [Sanghuangporus sanghuang]
MSCNLALLHISSSFSAQFCYEANISEHLARNNDLREEVSVEPDLDEELLNASSADRAGSHLNKAGHIFLPAPPQVHYGLRFIQL